jgi:hypothetical protein
MVSQTGATGQSRPGCELPPGKMRHDVGLWFISLTKSPSRAARPCKRARARARATRHIKHKASQGQIVPEHFEDGIPVAGHAPGRSVGRRSSCSACRPERQSGQCSTTGAHRSWSLAQDRRTPTRHLSRRAQRWTSALEAQFVVCLHARTDPPVAFVTAGGPRVGRSRKPDNVSAIVP